MRNIRWILLPLSLSFLNCSLLSLKETEHETTEISEPVAPVKKKVLLLNFLNQTSYSSADLTEHTHIEVEKMVETIKDCVILHENDLDEHDQFTTDGLHYNYKQIFEKAKSLGISAVIGGIIDDLEVRQDNVDSGLFRMENFNTAASIRLEIHDPQSGRELFSRSARGYHSGETFRFFLSRDPAAFDSNVAKEALQLALTKLEIPFVQQVRKVNWVGKIAKIDLERLYITGGEATGLAKGQLLKVTSPSFLIDDEKSNLHLGVAPGRFKGIIRIVDFVGKDGAVALIHSGAGFQADDRVEVFKP